MRLRVLCCLLACSVVLAGCDGSNCCKCAGANGESSYKGGALDYVDCDDKCSEVSNGSATIAYACGEAESPSRYLKLGLSSDQSSPSIDFLKEKEGSRQVQSSNFLQNARGETISFDEQVEFSDTHDLYLLEYAIVRTAAGTISAYSVKVVAKVGDSAAEGTLNYP
jgi:hypothetical protein